MSDTIQMGKMKPLQAGIIQSDGHYKGVIIMRTASNERFEVMQLTDAGEGKCWTGQQKTRKTLVQLIPSGTQITISTK
jgi:polynucleotide 5'-kinase involved in rRNA processing